MVVLVTGASGQLGQALKSISQVYPRITFHFKDSAEADITNKEVLSNIFELVKPNFTINAAAYTAVDKAESEPEKAALINVVGSKNLAEVCQEFDSVLIHISTDFVFDGSSLIPYKEDFPTNPTSVYGRTKRDGEQKIAAAMEKFFIIRTSWVYSGFGNNFMKTMLRLAAERDELNIVSDQIGTPTHAVDLAEAILHIITFPDISGKSLYGIYNYSNEGKASWFDFAAKIFELNHVSINLNPISTSQFPTPAKRPKYSVLDKEKIKDVFQLHIEDWETSLRKHHA